MLRRITLVAVGVCGLLLGAGVAVAQDADTTGEFQSATQGTMLADPSVQPASCDQDCVYNADGAYFEKRAKMRRRPLSSRYAKDGDCESGACKTGNCKLRSLNPFGARCGDGCDSAGKKCGDNDPACNFECADCFAKWDYEKRFILGYAHGDPVRSGTAGSYGQYHAGQIGIEILPWPITDGSACYLRWGGLFMFQYADYAGDKLTVLRSRQSNNFLTVNDGRTYSFIIGPTVRSDFEICGLRLSPNATIGASFDWTTIDGVPPQSPNKVISIDRFVFSGFDVGGFVRMMLDFPITDNINLGVGSEFRFAPTDIMVSDGDYRKHMTFVLAISHQF